MSYLSISPSVSHVSPVFCRLRTTLSLSRLSRPHVLAVFSCPKSAGHAHLRTRTRSLAIWPSPPSTQVMSRNEFDKITSVNNDTMLINDLNHNFSDFSNTHENIGLFSVLTVFESSISHVSHNDFVLPKESREIMQSGNRCWIERERKEKVLWSVLQSRCQRKVDGTVSVWVWRVTENFVLKSLRKFYSGGRDLRDQWRAQQAVVGENSDQRRWYLTEYNMAIQNLKRRISQHALFESQRELESQRQQLLEANQSELNEREYICVADWGWRFIFIKNAMQVVAEKWKNWKVAALKEGNHLKQDWLNFLRSMIRNHEQWVYSSTIQTYRAVMTVPTFLIKLSLPRVQECLAAKLECCEIHERIWVFLETFLIVNMLHEILMSYTLIQEIWRRHWRFWEKKEFRMGAKNHCNQYFSKSEKEKV